jgi:hypothetical protein
MTDTTIVNLVGQATIEVWGDLPRDIQEAIFELAVRRNPTIRNELAIHLHDRHPRTQHPPSPTAVA